MECYFGLAQDESGDIIPSAAVTVKLAGTGTLATLYSDTASTPTPLANPFTSGTDGSYQLFARSGRYDITLVKTGFSFNASQTRNILLDDQASVLTPPQITADQNNYAPTNGLNCQIWRLSSDAVRTITGIIAGFSGQRLTLINAGSFPIRVVNSASSSAANQIVFGGSAPNFESFLDSPMELVYDATLQRWRVLTPHLSDALYSADAATFTVNNTAVETTLLTMPITARSINSNGIMRVTWVGQFQNNTGGNFDYTPRIKYGGTTFHANLHTMAGGTSSHRLELILKNMGNTAIQIGLTRSDALNNAAAGFATFSSHTAAVINTAVDQNLVLTMQMGAANPNGSYLYDHAFVEILG